MVVGCSQAKQCGCQQDPRTSDPGLLAVGLDPYTPLEDKSSNIDGCADCEARARNSIDGCAESLDTAEEGSGNTNFYVFVGDTRAELSKTSTQTHELVAAFVDRIYTSEDTLIEDDDEIDNEYTDVFRPWLQPVDVDPDVDILDAIHIEGSPALQSALRSLCEEFRDIFANTLPSEPANVPPFKITVDKDKWETNQSRGPPRVQSAEKEMEIYRQVTALLDAGIIQHSPACYYSQVLLTKKPDGSDRMCIDFRKLNDCSDTIKHPLPNIDAIFERVGKHKPKVVGKLDLTQGYHQVPVEDKSMIFLAFICFMGVFEWCRLPFGPKKAPPFFQEIIATVVLLGLLYFIL